MSMEANRLHELTDQELDRVSGGLDAADCIIAAANAARLVAVFAESVMVGAVTFVAKVSRLSVIQPIVMSCSDFIDLERGFARL